MYQYKLNNVYFHNRILYATNHRHHNHGEDSFANRLIEIDRNPKENTEIVRNEREFQCLIMMIINKCNVQVKLSMDNYDRSN